MDEKTKATVYDEEGATEEMGELMEDEKNAENNA